MRLGLGVGIGGQGAFSPVKLPALWGWFNADNVTLDGNGRVSELKLIAGQGSNITQGDSTKRPNHGTVDGKDTIQFNPNAVSDTQHALPSAGPSGATGQTVTFVGQIVSGSGSFFEWATGAEIKVDKTEPDWRWANDESASEIQLVRSGPKLEKSLDVSSEDDGSKGLSFKDDGTKMYMAGTGGSSDRVYQYTLTTSWDIGTASFEKSFSVSVSGNITDVSFGDSGKKMYVTHNDFGASPSIQEARQYTLSTPWEVDTASFDKNFEDKTNITQVSDVFVSDGGSRMYVSDAGDRDIHQYTLSTAWDIGTANFVQTLSVSQKPRGLFLTDDGSKLFLTGQDPDNIAEYTLATPWDISTASLDTTLDVSSEEDFPQGVFAGDGGRKAYMTGFGSDKIHQYNLINNFDLSIGKFDALSLVYVDDTQAKVYINGQFVKDFDPADSNIQGNTPDFIADSGEADFNLRAFTVHEAVLSAGQIGQLHSFLR